MPIRAAKKCQPSAKNRREKGSRGIIVFNTSSTASTIASIASTHAHAGYKAGNQSG